MRRTFLLAAFAAMLALPALAQEGGVWQGTYDCAQGETYLRLTIGPEKNGSRDAVFYFYPKSVGANSASGCFSMTGRDVYGNGMFLYRQREWIKQPFGYVMVDLQGRVDRQNRVFEGLVAGPGCSRFRLQQVLDVADFQEACSPYTQ
jgi:hypothetical protein